jgi:hypothetical protein
MKHNTDCSVTVYLTKRTEEMWSHKEAASLSDGLSIYLYRRVGEEAKGLEGNEGNVFYAFQSKRKRGIHAFLSTCRLADVMLRPAVDFGTAKRMCTSLKLLGCSQKAVPAKQRHTRPEIVNRKSAAAHAYSILSKLSKRFPNPSLTIAERLVISAL